MIICFELNTEQIQGLGISLYWFIILIRQLVKEVYSGTKVRDQKFLKRSEQEERMR